MMAILVVVTGLEVPDSEFAHVETPPVNPFIATSTPTLPTIALSTPRTAVPHDWTIEVIAAVAVLLYILFYLFGRQRNLQLSRQFVDRYHPWLREQFSHVGMGANSPSTSPLIKISDSSWEIWCSGRRNCFGMYISLTLQPRQDLFATIVSFLAPQLAPQGDILTVEIPIDETTTPSFTFSVMEARMRKEIDDSRKDLMAYKPKLSSGQGLGLPEALCVLSEASEVSSERDLIFYTLCVCDICVRLVQVCVRPGQCLVRSFW